LRYHFQFELEMKLARIAASLKKDGPPIAGPTKPQKEKAKRALTKKDVPNKYSDGTETPKGIFDRMRRKLHLTLLELQELVEDEFSKQETKRREDSGLGPCGEIGFCVDLFYNICKGENTVSLKRLQALASVFSRGEETFTAESLRWRECIPNQVTFNPSSTTV